MEIIIYSLLGAAAGGIITFAVTAARARQASDISERRILELGGQLATAREELAAARAERDARKQLDSERGHAEEQLKESFEALAGRVLKASNSQFLELASTKFATAEQQAKNELEKREEAVRQMLKPLTDNLSKLGEATFALEGKREKAYGELKNQLEHLSLATSALNSSSTELAGVLKGSSQARGRWGEMALRNIVETAGMTRHCDFTEQVADGGGNRPDMVIKLPGNGLIPVDAKVPFADFEQYTRETDPERRDACLKAHASALKNQVKELVRKDYAGALSGEIDFTIMFVPSEAMLAAAFEHSPDFYADAMRNKILVASPATLVALLRTIGIYWRGEQMAANADKVWQAASTLYERLTTFGEHLAKTGKGLDNALKAYNQAVGTFANRIVPAGRKLEELGTDHDQRKTVPELEPIEATARVLSE